MEAFEDDLDILELVDVGFPRQIYNRSNHYNDMDNLTFFKRFRLTKPTVMMVLELIENQLEYPHDRNNSVSPLNQLLTCLRLYATGGHLSSVADLMGQDVSTTSRIVKKVSTLLAQLREMYIHMPEGQEVVEVQHSFFQKHSFPKVIGTIDGTHIKIQSPGGIDPMVFMNRKGYYSINVQIIGDSNLKVRDIVARWPGSAHDQTIFINSRVHTRFENNEFQNCVLIGDSGYALKNYLLTPLMNPQDPGQLLYNESHIRTRNSAERLNGVLKRRFPILAYGIRLNLDTVLAIIPACAVLHNLAILQHEEEPPLDANIMEHINYLIEMGNIEDVPVHGPGPYFHDNNRGRNIVLNYFNTLARR